MEEPLRRRACGQRSLAVQLGKYTYAVASHGPSVRAASHWLSWLTVYDRCAWRWGLRATGGRVRWAEPMERPRIKIANVRLVSSPGRKVHSVLPQFAGTNSTRPSPAQRSQLLAFVASEYAGSRLHQCRPPAAILGEAPPLVTGGC